MTEVVTHERGRNVPGVYAIGVLGVPSAPNASGGTTPGLGVSFALVTHSSELKSAGHTHNGVGQAQLHPLPGHLQLALSTLLFFQIHPFQNPLLYQRVNPI